MKQVFVTLAMIGLVACQTEDKVHIMGIQHDFTQDEVTTVDSTSIFGPFLPGEKDNLIDSLTTVNELLDHLETLPAE
jgi:hypothetical protein